MNNGMLECREGGVIRDATGRVYPPRPVVRHSVDLAETICTVKRLANEVEVLARTPSAKSAQLADTFRRLADAALAGLLQSVEEMVPQSRAAMSSADARK